MSDTYDINGVKVTPLGGGYYELKHPSLADVEKVQGKEKAEERAREIAASAQPSDGSIEEQQPLGEAKDASLAEQLEAVKAKLVATEQERDEAKEEVAKVRTVVSEGGDEAGFADSRVPNSVPRAFSGTMEAKDKKALKKLGIETTRIVLEENDDIPPTGLFIGHNGRGYMISPGEPVDVPNFLLDVLDNAVMSAPIVDSKSQKVLGYRDRMKYSYRTVK